VYKVALKLQQSNQSCCQGKEKQILKGSLLKVVYTGLYQDSQEVDKNTRVISRVITDYPTAVKILKNISE
jgi:hypothetical protein